MSKQTPGLFHPNGEVNRAYIDKLAHDATCPLIRRVWATHRDRATMARLVGNITALGSTAHITEFTDALALLHTLVGLDFSQNIESVMCHPATASYFMLACLIHADEAVSEEMR